MPTTGGKECVCVCVCERERERQVHGHIYGVEKVEEKMCVVQWSM